MSASDTATPVTAGPAGAEKARGPAPGPKKKPDRPMDFSKYPQRHIVLRLAYDGSGYDGLARQPHTTRTVEHELLSALVRVRLIEDLWPDDADLAFGSSTVAGTRRRRDDAAISGRVLLASPPKFSRCGRTDKGVSALGNAVSLMVRAAREGEPDLEYQRMLNRALPPSVRITAWAFVADDFDARFSCRSRTYRYFFPRRAHMGVVAPTGHALAHAQHRINVANAAAITSGTATTALSSYIELDVGKMQEACTRLVGEHDFSNFCHQDVVNVSNFTRTVRRAFIIDPSTAATSAAAAGGADAPLCYLEIEATAFLYHQIRCTMAVLFAIGAGLESPELVSQLLDVKTTPCKPSYALASDLPLVLWDCTFDAESVQWRVDTSGTEEVCSLLHEEAESARLRHAMKDAMCVSVAEFAADKATTVPSRTAALAAAAVAAKPSAAAAAAAPAAATAVVDAAPKEMPSLAELIHYQKFMERPREREFSGKVSGLSANKQAKRLENMAKGGTRNGTRAGIATDAEPVVESG